MTELAHFTWLKGRIGLHAIPGPADNPEIVAMFKHTDAPPSMWHDCTAWCAACQCAALEENGEKSPHSAAALSFAEWGHEVDWVDALPGDMVLFEWTDEEGNVTGHHVAQFYSQQEEFVSCLGGNQVDHHTGFHEVCVKTFRKDDVINVRRA
jgi:hypothetical protein